jgi:ferredoxin-fold anticodon binding domain-containing protein
MNSEIYAYDPILLEKVEINTWLSESPDNIIILIDYHENTHINALSQFESKKLNIFALNKNYIQNVNIRDIFLKCLLINEQLLPFTTYKSKSEFYNLGFYFNRNILINLNEVKPSKLIGQFFNLTLSNNKEKYINKEYLLLSNIGIEKPIKTKLIDINKLSAEEKEQFKKEQYNKILEIRNLPFNKDVYFEKILALALKNYTYQWDIAINTFLRTDVSYFSTDEFIKYYKRFGDTIEEAIQAVINKITHLDRVFIEAAPRNENPNKIYWRGMKSKFIGLDKIGDKIAVNNFMSLSTDYKVARQFTDKNSVSKCCMYKVVIDKGIPYIDMVNNTNYIKEREILLPRGLVFELIDIIENKTPTKTMLIRVSMSKTSVKEFQIKTGCREFVLAKLEPIKKTAPFFEIYNKNVKTKSNSVKVKKEIDNNDKVPSVKKRCPNGSRRNKLTGLCERHNKGSNISEPKNKTEKKNKLPNCPKGTRRNKITKLCEPHFKPHADTKFVIH